jgi:hypothetical protein
MNKKETKRQARRQLFSLEAYLLTREINKYNKKLDRRNKKHEHEHESEHEANENVSTS